ncbi:MAG: hypothetical protein CL678_14085 [Bdellovibrionaceae bacterium]|nr:hypothetical protein [Pseudobdellovibrionaceae bacterium]|tara:strand:- start:299 stop:949 length:651 start_codon:yes stop_codon:yes gene_type:complete
MEKAKYTHLKIYWTVIWTAFFIGSPLALSDVVMMESDTKDPREDFYPQSYFGKSPAKPLKRKRFTADPDVIHIEKSKSEPGRGLASMQGTGNSHATPAESRMENYIYGFKNPSQGPDAGLSGTDVRKGVQEISLIANDSGFFPKTIFVTKDVPVRMFVTGASTNQLCLMMDSFSVRKQVKENQIEEVTFTPKTSGKYRYYCPINGAEGTIVVKEPS